MASSAAGALSALSDSTSTGPIFSLHTTLVPFQGMPGVVAYHVVPSTSTAVLHQGVLLCGELMVSRLDGDIRKSYSYVYGVTSTGGTIFGGPFKAFILHHTPRSCTAGVADFFGHNPLAPRRRAFDGAG